MAEQEKIDKLLDRALGEYGETSPRAGLEGRVLARLEAEATHPLNLRWWWIAVPAMAVLIVIAILLAWSPQPKKVDIANVPPVRVGVQPAPPTVAEPSPTATLTRPRGKHLRPKAPAKATPEAPDSEPRLATFPSRDADDQLVKLAMQFVQTHPEKAQEIVQEQKEFREMAEVFTAPLKDKK